MEVSRPFELKNASLTSNILKRVSSFDLKKFPPPQTVKLDHIHKNDTKEDLRKAKRSTRCSLPKTATTILKDWLLMHWLDPYPSEEEKYRLAQATGLKVVQVCNWLINARRRILPGICLQFGLDHSKCRLAKRGGNRDLLLRRMQSHTDPFADWGKVPHENRPNDSPNLDRYSHSFPGLMSPSDESRTLVNDQVSSNVTTYEIVLENPGSPEHPSMLEYLADVMLVNEELEKQPNHEGLSRMELLCRRGLGERLYPVTS